MVGGMRTTIELPDGLAEEAQWRAHETGRTFTSLVVEGLRLVLADRQTDATVAMLPAHGDPGERPLIDLSDRNAVDER
jgi:hypothetical protein